MKSLIISILLSCSLIISVLNSCKKDSNGNPEILSNKMSARINNVDWTTLTRVTVLQSDKFIVTGVSLTGQSLSITIIGSLQGTYDLSAIPPKAMCEAVYKASVTASTTDIYVATNGIVTLSKVDKTNKLISGVFEFDLRKDLTGEILKITNGRFDDLKYTEGSK